MNEEVLMDAVEASVETGMNRVMSGVFNEEDMENGGAIEDIESDDEKKERQRVLYQERVKADGERWAGKGLGLLQDGTVPKGEQAVSHSVNEFLRGLIRGGTFGALLKASLSFLLSLLGGKGGISKAVKAAVSPDTRQFALFVGTMTGVFRGVNAALTAYTERDDPSNALIAGAISGLTLLFDEASRRKAIALYLFSRSLDVITKMLVRKGQIPYWKHFEGFMFGVTNMPIMYGFLFMPEILQPSYYKWILNMGNVTHSGLDEAMRVRYNKFYQEGILIPFRPCSQGFHEGPCTVHCVSDWFLGLARAGKIYLPVHLIPLLLFRYKALLKDPVPQLIKTGTGLISSCLFLSTYVFFVKSTQCFLRNLRHVDAGWHGVLAGLLTGLSTLFEQPSRVSELMLYCLPRGMEATWIYMEKQGWVKSIPKFEAVFMAAAMGTLLASRKIDNKRSYYNTLCFLIGSKSAGENPPGLVVPHCSDECQDAGHHHPHGDHLKKVKIF